MWKGSVSFGLVNVPVRMFAATESKDVKFRLLHKACSTPVRYTRVCPTCNQEVQWEDIVRGYEYAPGQFVILDDEELESLNKPRSHTIDITEFVELSQVDPIFYDKSYYLAPETSGIKAYRLLMEAMRSTGKVAIARTVLRNAETLGCLRVYQDVLVMETLYWPDEIRPTTELPNQTPAAITEQELNMAVMLIGQLATEFTPDKYQDDRRQAILAAIEAKVNQQEVAVAPPAGRGAENIVDLMEALQASLRAAKPTKRKRKKSS